MIVALFATPYLLHESIATGAMGMLFFILAIPVLSLAFVGWAVAGRSLSDGLWRVPMVATIVLACGVWTLIRTGGFTGDLDHDFAWRWAATPEERLLAQAGDEPLPLVKTAFDKFTELARIPAIEGKTWNHPVLAGDVLLVRNGQEMVAFRLTLAAG